MVGGRGLFSPDPTIATWRGLSQGQGQHGIFFSEFLGSETWERHSQGCQALDLLDF